MSENNDTPQKVYPVERPRFRTNVNGNGLELSILLPGVARENLSVNVEDRLLNLTAERRFDGGEEDRDYQLQVKLNDDLDPSKIEATHQNGVLTLKLVKRQELAPRRIDILAN
ncbi:MAG: Hsp20/alpha crystallin family protein [Verrucomicrobiaceae bacterium]